MDPAQQQSILSNPDLQEVPLKPVQLPKSDIDLLRTYTLPQEGIMAEHLLLNEVLAKLGYQVDPKQKLDSFTVVIKYLLKDLPEIPIQEVPSDESILREGL